jgi:hypothetical protein
MRLSFFFILCIHFSYSQSIIEQNDRLHFLHKSMDVKSSIIIYNQQKNRLITNDTLAFKELILQTALFFFMSL